jgi:menaquinol-cytochrome c reductase iron-sulfur subunit
MNREDVTRRNFMIRTITGIFVFIGAALTAALGGFGIIPALKKTIPGWNDVGNVADLPIDQPQQRRFLDTVKSGWESEKVERDVWVYKKPDGTVVIYSPNCPHLGCGYRWIAAHNRFECPCHGSVFALDGKVLAGPAPRPLDTLPSRIENGRLFVQYEVFQLGISKKIVA